MDTTRYIVFTKVVKVEEKFEKTHVSGFGADTKFIERSKGWFIYLRGSYEALYLGTTKPDFVHGDEIKITFEKAPHAQP